MRAQLLAAGVNHLVLFVNISLLLIYKENMAVALLKIMKRPFHPTDPTGYFTPLLSRCFCSPLLSASPITCQQQGTTHLPISYHTLA